MIYLLFLVILGIPVMTMEYAMGRSTRKSILSACRELEPEGSECRRRTEGASGPALLL